MTLVATDLDGTFGRCPEPAPVLCISGRTWAEYDDRARSVAQTMPLYIRGVGAYGDRLAAAYFKRDMIRLLGVTRYYEDDPLQADVITRECQGVEVVII